MTIPNDPVERAAREPSDELASDLLVIAEALDQERRPTFAGKVRRAAQRLEARGEISEAQARLLRGSNATLRQALERLGSSEAFTSSHVIPHTPTGDELKARMEFARAALEAALSNHETKEG